MFSIVNVQREDKYASMIVSNKPAVITVSTEGQKQHSYIYHGDVQLSLNSNKASVKQEQTIKLQKEFGVGGHFLGISDCLGSTCNTVDTLSLLAPLSSHLAWQAWI